MKANMISELTTKEITKGIPENEALKMASAMLFAVYGWNPSKVSRMKLSLVERWVSYANNRMTWGDAYEIRQMLLPKEVPLWKRIFRING